MIVVSMTSWTKRITYVKQVVESIMNNTVKPDRVYLNLSKTEFEGIDLPKDLVDYFNSDERLIINWVGGPNVKSMKKIFPILKYLNDDDIIIDADDDIIFPKDLIESRLKDFEKYNKEFSISSNTHTSVGFDGKMRVVSAISLFQKKMFKNWNKFLTQKIIETSNDDRTYLHLLWLNGYYNKGCSKWTVQELLQKYDMKLDSSVSKTNFKSGNAYDIVAYREFYGPRERGINDSFGILRYYGRY